MCLYHDEATEFIRNTKHHRGPRVPLTRATIKMGMTTGQERRTSIVYPNTFDRLHNKGRQGEEDTSSEEGVEHVGGSHGAIGMDDVVRHHPKTHWWFPTG